MKEPMEISNNDDVIDSRDIIERIEWLENEREYIQEQISETEDEEEKLEYLDDMAQWEEDYQEELDSLLSLQDEVGGMGDWKYGETLIRSSYWVDYCEQLVEDIGYIPRDLPGFLRDNIDWDGVADDLEVDYSRVDFGGVEYLICNC